MVTSYVVVSDLVKIYKKGKAEAALEGINIEFNKNELSAVIGPSGSGKTTLLNCIGGLLRPSAGRVVVDGLLISHSTISELIKFRQTKVGFVFQEFNLIPGISVENNILLPAKFAKQEKKIIKTRLATLLDQLDISSLSKLDVELLSGGEKQRVSIATALINNPDLIIADEPTGQLDAENTEIVADILVDLSKSGKCVIIATHDPRVAKKAHKIFRLSRKKIENVHFEQAFY